MYDFKKCGSNALNKHEKLLEKLEDERVFSIECSNGEFYILEQCDEYFSYSLTKEECIELSELFRELAEECKE